VKRQTNGKPVRGPNGEFYKELDGSVLMGLNGKPARASTKYLYYGWHYGNTEEDCYFQRASLDLKKELAHMAKVIAVFK